MLQKADIKELCVEQKSTIQDAINSFKLATDDSILFGAIIRLVERILLADQSAEFALTVQGLNSGILTQVRLVDPNFGCSVFAVRLPKDGSVGANTEQRTPNSSWGLHIEHRLTR